MPVTDATASRGAVIVGSVNGSATDMNNYDNSGRHRPHYGYWPRAMKQAAKEGNFREVSALADMALRLGVRAPMVLLVAAALVAKYGL